MKEEIQKPFKQEEGEKEMPYKKRAARIMDLQINRAVLKEFFVGIASCEYYDGTSYQLYLDLDDNSLSVHREANSCSYLQRNDGSLIQLCEAYSGGDCDIPMDKRYTVGCDLCDYGYTDWLDEIEERITAELANLGRE